MIQLNAEHYTYIKIDKIWNHAKFLRQGNPQLMFERHFKDNFSWVKEEVKFDKSFELKFEKVIFASKA